VIRVASTLFVLPRYAGAVSRNHRCGKSRRARYIKVTVRKARRAVEREHQEVEGGHRLRL